MNCHICNAKLKGNEGPACPNCGTNLANPDERVVLVAMTCDHSKSAINVQQGSAVLTDRRFIWMKAKAGAVVGAVAGGLVGAAIAGAAGANAGKVVYDIPRQDIVSLEDTKHGVRKALTFHTRGGEAYKFLISNREEWRAAVAGTVAAQ